MYRTLESRTWRIVAAAVLGPALLAAAAPAEEGRGANPAEATVHVITQVSPPDYFSPWQRGEVEEYLGSGVIIEGGRILTNAHLVAHHVMVEVRREGTARRFPARVEHVCHACDLALLSVEGERFFEGVRPLELGPLPRLREEVQAYGFPIGGDSLSVTSGVVSRIEVGMYTHSFEALLLVQIDAAINPGNSGGPVVSGGRLVGVSTQVYEEAENIGYIIPTPIIHHFLKDVEDGAVDGFPSLGIEMQTIQNDALRDSLRMPGDMTGVLVRRVNYGSPAWGVLRQGDVIHRVDGVPVDEDLTVPLADGKRVDASHRIRSHQVGESVALSILRKGEKAEAEVRLGAWTPLVPNFTHERWPTYYVFGGIVFQPLKMTYLSLFEDLPTNLAPYALDDNLVTEHRRQVVVVTGILKHRVNKGYEVAEDLVVAAVDGRRPADIRDLVSMVEGAGGPWLEILTENGMRLVLDLEKAREAGPRILALHGIPADRSPDLRPAGER